jgi:hypothetical protein
MCLPVVEFVVLSSPTEDEVCETVEGLEVARVRRKRSSDGDAATPTATESDTEVKEVLTALRSCLSHDSFYCIWTVLFVLAVGLQNLYSRKVWYSTPHLDTVLVHGCPRGRTTQFPLLLYRKSVVYHIYLLKNKNQPVRQRGT